MLVYLLLGVKIEYFRLFGRADVSGGAAVARTGARHIKLDLRPAGSLATQDKRSGMLTLMVKVIV